MTESVPDLEPSLAPKRPPWRRLFHAGMVALILVLAAADAWLFGNRRRYEGEIARLRSSMTQLERERTDEIIAGEDNRLRVAIALIQRQAKLEPDLHLSVSVDSGAMYLEQEGAVLRAMPIEIGSERTVGVAPDTVRMAAPRGVRTVARILSDADAWPTPDWVYVERGLPIPAESSVRGAVGPVAIALDGGTIIYTMPSVGPMNDSSYVMPGAIRARADDLRAVLPNLKPGMRVYFY